MLNLVRHLDFHFPGMAAYLVFPLQRYIVSLPERRREENGIKPLQHIQSAFECDSQVKRS